MFFDFVKRLKYKVFNIFNTILNIGNTILMSPKYAR